MPGLSSTVVFCTKHNGRQLCSEVFICNKLDVSKHPRSTLQHVMLNAAAMYHLVTVESHPTPGDSRDSSSPSRSLSGVSSHVADGGSARIPLESVHPSLPWSSSLSRSIHSPEHHVILHPSCSHHVSKVA